MADGAQEHQADRPERPCAVRRLRNSRGPVLVALWFLGPSVAIQTNEQGGWSVALGASRGQYEVVSRGCSGTFIDSRPVPVTAGGAVLEYAWPDAPFRVSAFAGATDAGADPSGAYYGGLLAWEARRLGLGFGQVLVPQDIGTSDRTASFPSIYVRIGDRPGGSFRADFFAPSPFFGATGLLRGGVNLETEGVDWLFGLSAGRALDTGDNGDNGGPFVEARWPVSDRLDLTLGGSFWEFERDPDWGAGLALRYRF